ncbi:MAG TPA: DnaA/Hda family protein, partial [Acidimicrobiales bacterium]|nr:DnaA/Hda family protein [Acidimicrobiales bacterium]
MQEAQHLWGLCAASLRADVSEATWRAWFETIEPLDLDGTTLVLAVPSPLAKERLEGRHLGQVRNALAAVDGRDLDLRVVVRTAAAPTEAPGPGPAPAADPSPTPKPAATLAGGTGATTEAALNPRYTFDAFVIGASNRFAHAAALSVAETPAKSYNPLFVHGGAGLGKTHLLHAIGNYIDENYPDRYIRYVSTETFLNE